VSDEAVVNQRSSHLEIGKNQKRDTQVLKNVFVKQDQADPNQATKEYPIFFFHDKSQ